MSTGSMSQIDGEVQAGSDGTTKDAGGSIRSNPAGRRREDRIVGATQATQDLIAQATAAARSDLPVILIGPPGSDKDLVSRAIHTWGRRSENSLETLSCSAIPEVLQAREIFGCAEGVYPAKQLQIACVADGSAAKPPVAFDGSEVVGFDEAHRVRVAELSAQHVPKP